MDVQNHKKKDADKEEIGRNVWVLVCPRILEAWFGFMCLFGLLMLFCFCDLQAADFIGLFLQLQHCRAPYQVIVVVDTNFINLSTQSYIAHLYAMLSQRRLAEFHFVMTYI
jgi:hypothetical protein